MRKTVVSLMLLVLSANLAVYGQQHPKQRMPFVTDTPIKINVKSLNSSFQRRFYVK